MTDNVIRIDTGSVRLKIEDEAGTHRGDLVFNPSDLLFAEKFYSLVEDFKGSLSDFSRKMTVAEAVTAKDDDGLPVNAVERMGLLKETCEYIRGKIDYLFGKGTSEMVFGEALNLDMYLQFFDAISPYIEKARTVQVKKYAKSKK